MDNDDILVGQLLSRREALILLGGASLSLVGAGSSSSAAERIDTGSPTATCVVRPQLTEGPFFVDERLNRADIRADPATGATRAGVLLTVAFGISRLNGAACTPLPGVFVDVWHCDAAGLYSDVRANGTVGQKFLRGYQVTDANGLARFTTIYPGWYSGRAVHIHFKIRTELSNNSAYEYTSQLFFPESLNSTVHAQPPYAGRGQRKVLNSNDGIYRGGGSQLLLDPKATGEGYAAQINLAVQI
ncbi:MAG TPA: intradiol ring-cleavage dioxygenase [Longimicrobiales bacterium]|nr:intradiol ring-cleavage dioxygenase [Longimicrobiales bacterium]